MRWLLLLGLPHALPRVAVRLSPLEACGVFPPLHTGGCYLVWRAPGAHRTGFVLYCHPHFIRHLGAVSVVPPAPALPSERSLRVQIRPSGGALFPDVAGPAPRRQLCAYVTPQSVSQSDTLRAPALFLTSAFR